MADGDATLALADATEMMDEVYDLNVIPIDTRFGATAQHIMAEDQFLGGAMHKKVLTTTFTGARASASLESDAPDAYEIGTTDITIEESNLRQLAFTLKYTIPAGMQVRGEHAVWDLATELTLQSAESVGEKRNQLLNQDANCVKALVAATYKFDGDTYPGGTATVAFIKIDNGSISAFHKGMILDIRNASTTTIRVTATVNDVCHSTQYRGRDVGPGISVTYNSTYAGAGNTDAHFDNVADNDEIVDHGETDGCGFDGSFSNLIDLSNDPSTYFGVNRSTQGNHYLVPYGRDYASATMNVDTVFGQMNNILGMVFSKSREYRRNRGFQMTQAIVCQAQPDLVADVARQVGEGSSRFTQKIASDFTGGKSPLVAVAGWEGAVIHTPGLPPIVLQSEPLAPSNDIRVFEPSAFEWIRFGPKRPQFIKAPGGPIWHVRTNTSTGNLTKTLQASAFVMETLYCNQPQLVYAINSVVPSIV